MSRRWCSAFIGICTYRARQPRAFSTRFFCFRDQCARLFACGRPVRAESFPAARKP
ncbi:methyltransferase [Burkholderia thailandensis]|nr:methyltransferase [Burkholderia thailandensis]MDD1480863.1 methyltransferase [Burkholderia thailandensis]MDD1489245.1 methyltransferase [Burkholderia thailandensis]MDD1493802.1 methyltransferase [Burkholderia thailandensis]PNE75078.1 methyltransferase [Burkholderia thailandensis]